MRPELRNKLQHFLTPQFLLNLRLLALPNNELANLIRELLEQNPVLEEVPPEEAADIEAEERKESSDDFEFADFLQMDLHQPSPNPEPSRERPDRLEASDQGEAVSILEWFRPQLRRKLPPQDWPIADYILLNLDDDGFLSIPFEGLAELAGANQERFSKVLSVIQRLDPPGLGASSRKESLLIQLEASGLKPESLEYRVVAECYEKLLDSGGGPAQIATWLSVPKIEIEQALVNIRKLDPRPARRFGRSASYIYPDFSIEWWQGQLQGFLNDDEIPRIRVAPSYLGMLKEPDQFSQEEISFVRRKVKNAILLIKGIEQRRTTLKRLLEYILAEQVEFFQHGKECLKPLSMAEAAAALGCHPSTISRAVHAKYVETPLGIFELKLFFTSRIEESSKAGLKERIRKLIAEEDSQNPYSDAAIARLLARERTHLARRTVAKYRNQLGIPSARKRRR